MRIFLAVALFASLAMPGLAEAQVNSAPDPVCEHVPLTLRGANAPARQGPPQARLNDPGVYDAFMKFRAELAYTPTMEMRDVRLTARWSRPDLVIEVPPIRDAQGRTDGTAFYTVLMVPRDAMALPRTPSLSEAGAVRARVAQGDGAAQGGGPATLKVTFEPPSFYLRQTWRIFLLPCFADGTGRVTASEFAEQDVRLLGRWAATGIGLLVVLGIALLLGQAAYAINGWQLDPTRTEGQAPITTRLSPIFICQDAFGYASLARFQVFLFSLVLLGVYAYAFAASLEVPEVSNTVLALAGITLAGSTLAAAASKPSLESPNRLWLWGTGVLRQSRRVPRWNDLVTGDGEVDITRVQALGFSLFAACALVFLGAEKLGSFEIPQQLNYLIGLSQAVYVAGKALPVDSLRRLNADLEALRGAEKAAIGKAEASPEFQEYMRLKTGVSVSLVDVFGPRIDRERLLTMGPGARMTATPPQSPGGFAPA